MTTIDAAKKMSTEQTARWHWLLRAIDVGETQSLVARAKCRADGYLLGLLDAKVINEDDRQALHEEATTREVAAAHRVDAANR